MNSGSTDELDQPVRNGRQLTVADETHAHQASGENAPSDAAAPSAKAAPEENGKPDAKPDSQAKSAANDKSANDKSAKEKDKPKEVAPAKVKMQSRLPALDDDADVGVQKEQIVTRDGKPDLAFTGALLASAASGTAPKGHWQEYRIYQTNGGKHVFSKVQRTIYAEERDTCEAQVFDPAPSSMPSQLLKSARELAHARERTWMDAAADFFGYDTLAKALYRKLSGRFEEHIG